MLYKPVNHLIRLSIILSQHKEDREAESKTEIYCARGRRNKTANKENADLETPYLSDKIDRTLYWNLT